MRVGILTFHFVLHPGAALQASALRKALVELGHQTNIVDYRPINQTHVKKLPRRPTRLAVHLLQAHRYRSFRRRHLCLSSRRYATTQDLIQDLSKFDAFVTGSDQIWNPLLHGFDPVYFLSFVPDGIRRIAYAPSFGDVRLLGSYETDLRQLLERFDSLSARESEGVDFIRHLTGRTAAHVVDPVLLCDPKYTSFAQHTESNSLAVYPLEISPSFVRIASSIAQLLRLKLVNLGGPGTPLPSAHNWPACVGPEDWMKYLQKAAFVLTNSYHGMLFSIIFEKQFLIYPFSQRMVRIEDMLDRVGLSERIVTSEREALLVARKTINYDKVGKRIAELRSSAISYLVGSLV